MRRSALLGLTCLLLGGCQFAGNPFSGFGGFLYDTHTFHSNPNLPAGSDETMRRVEDKDVSVEPLLPEPGDIWPGPMRPIPTMQEMQKQDMQQLPPPNIPSAPPPLLFPGETPGASSDTAPPAAASSGHVPKNGQHTRTGNTQATPPGDSSQGVMVPNGNGTSTLIRPDGTIETVPTPK